MQVEFTRVDQEIEHETSMYFHNITNVKTFNVIIYMTFIGF